MDSHMIVSFTQPFFITFFTIPYIAKRPICTFLSVGQRLLPCSLKSQIFSMFSVAKFLVVTIFLMILLNVLLFSPVVLHFILLSTSLASNIHHCTGL